MFASRAMRRRAALVCVVLALGLPALVGGARTQEKAAVDGLKPISGQVVPLAEHLAKDGHKLDADAAPTSRVLVADDGRVYPLIKDAGSRMFFQDAKLLGRPMRLVGRLLPKSDLFQVVGVQSLVNGVPHDVYYWCDICTIRGYEFVICDCCGGPMERREEKAKP